MADDVAPVGLGPAVSPLWSWALMVLGAAGLLIAMRGLWWGWLVNVGAQVAWLIYGATTGQWGFVGSAFMYAFVYGYGARRARAGGARGARRGHVTVARAQGARATGRRARKNDARRACAAHGCQVCAWAHRNGA